MTSRQHTGVRVDNETLVRIAALQKRLSTTWRDATISDVLRALIYAGLEVMEKSTPRKLKGIGTNQLRNRSRERRSRAC
jgi:hypothetical protein